MTLVQKLPADLKAGDVIVSPIDHAVKFVVKKVSNGTANSPDRPCLTLDADGKKLMFDCVNMPRGKPFLVEVPDEGD